MKHGIATGTMMTVYALPEATGSFFDDRSSIGLSGRIFLVIMLCLVTLLNLLPVNTAYANTVYAADTRIIENTV